MVEARGSIPERVRRALYGLSRGQCYAPECDEPVVVLDGGEPVFVGEVAHIVAAVASGPRGGVDVPDRDAFENLLILCGRHHKIIDDVRTRDRYPVEVLREWKAKREAEIDTATREVLHGLGDLTVRLPDLLVQAFRDATAELSAAVDRLEATGQLNHDTAQLLHVALAGIGSAVPRVGDGVPGVKEAFEEVYAAAGGASFLGLPSADAYEVGPGVVQHLRGARCGHPSVICAILGRPAVVITADLWNGIARVGAGRPGGGVHGVGFPVHTAGSDQCYIGPAVDEVPTAGGSWRGGAMCRTEDGRWIWIPDLVFDPNNAGNADAAFSSQTALDLRLRLVGQIPLTEQEPRLPAAGRRRLTAELAKSEMTAIVAALAAERTAVPPELRWRLRGDQFALNDSWGASYGCVILAADGRPAIRGTLQLLMPSLMRAQQITSIVDIEFDFDGCNSVPCQPNAPVARRLSHAEIADFFITAWGLAFDVLPLALGERPGGDPGERPRADLYVINERGQNTGGERTFRLGDLVDLAAFGTTHKTHLSRLGIGVVGRGSLHERDVRDVVRQALVRSAEDAGFDAADLVTW
ncbi:hypothetical protein [Dactylosporangium matsuzakiense]|uniref:hypothetical protein n=1 Tax=Dactylosporangium matsuzakiense TaxID=53360 RepID=UPI0021C2C302|nr:hypothetical protein [Dactylosporangium matsuzakiense]UWZ43891.1 hypothetical protein Dmats_41820 [Dactylosporangium matsuzakiense]